MTHNALGTLIQYNPITVSPDSTLELVLQHVTDAGVRDLPVVDGQNRVLGILTRDVIEQLDAAQRAKPWTTQVIDIMVDLAYTVAPNMPPREALEQLNRRNVQAAPVVDNGQLIGMIAVEDLSALND